ncbi:ATP-binding protein [Effusibacillus dendaii]|uniref:histidine kinase n=1 Tax=Effusibacillus dendaii TaxID=2743772 RepID=A0A7I8DE15_9BACL|nr:ATP-binding protein [Effusibacillus dendaii]BCJ88267.1 sensor histidine kinase [Effusibacillus dendaii]
MQEVDALLVRVEAALREAEFDQALQQTEDAAITRIYRILGELPMADEAVVLDAAGSVKLGANRFKIMDDLARPDWQDPAIISRLREGSVYYSPVLLANNGIPSVKVVVPYFSPDRRMFWGGIGVQIRLRSLFELVGSRHAGKQEEVFLVDQSGTLIAHDDFTKVLQQTDVAKSFTVRHFLEDGNPGGLPSPNRYQNYAGQEVLGVYSKLARTGWAAVVEQPVSAAFASIYSLLGKLAWFLFFIVAGAVLLSVFFGLFFTKPIEQLEKTVRQVGRGVLDIRISTRRKDELGSLMTAFNQMTAHLRMQSEKLLQEKEQLDAVVNGIGAGLALVYPDCRVAWMNPLLEKWVRFDRNNQLFTCHQMFVNSPNPCSGCPIILQRDTRELWDQQITILSQQGEQKVLRHQIYHLEHVRPGDPEYLIVVEDITEQRRMEEMLMQADKLSALGLMASGFVHEINNPLATIQAYAEDLEDRLRSERDGLTSEDVARYLRIIRDNISRSKKVTQHMLNFSRKSEWKQEYIHVPSVLEESLSLFAHAFAKKRVRLEKEWETDLPRVKGDSLQLMQVIVNLLNNSLDAVSDNGIIKLTVGFANSRLQIRLCDNGTGIPKEYLNKVFDPFFTTKKVGKGTGLGLSICYGIITRMGGVILLNSVEGQGTEAVIDLPVIDSKGGATGDGVAEHQAIDCG